jgi:hypothetical protein
MFGPRGPYCQSCGMPLSKDPMVGGTNADCSRSTEFCSHCYRAGSFTEPDITVDQMVAKVQQKLKEMRFPGFIARYFSRSIPTLRRWRNQGAASSTR